MFRLGRALGGRGRAGGQCALETRCAPPHPTPPQPRATLASSTNDAVKVVVRIRPPSETTSRSRCVIQAGPSAVALPDGTGFTFDAVAGVAADNDAVFAAAGRPIVDAVLAGYNGCVFAYGQTGSGKTHTMLGDLTGGPGAGLAPRAFASLFERAAELDARDGGSTKVRVSFVEIYNETITDLLAPVASGATAPPPALPLREDARRGVYVDGAIETSVSCADDAVALLARGAAARRAAETRANASSSRSHAVLIAVVERAASEGRHGRPPSTRARLTLVDLAGSERAAATGADGARLREACGINRSLSALGNVIVILADAATSGRPPRHVPYRDSRLTFLLAESLGGNAKTALVATVSCDTAAAAETLSTLRFAARASRVTCRAVVNAGRDGGGASELEAEVARLRAQVAALQLRAAAAPPADAARTPPPAASMPPSRDASPALDFGDAAASLVDGTTPLVRASDGGAHPAVVAALRREAAATARAAALDTELAAVRELARRAEADGHRVRLVLKLREDRLARLEGRSGESVPPDAAAAAEIEALRLELAAAKDAAERPPSEQALAVQVLRLERELEEARGVAAASPSNTAAASAADVDHLRTQALAAADAADAMRSAHEAALADAAAARGRAEAYVEGAAAEAVALRGEVEAARADASAWRRQLADMAGERDTLTSQLDAARSEAADAVARADAAIAAAAAADARARARRRPLLLSRPPLLVHASQLPNVL